MNITLIASAGLVALAGYLALKGDNGEDGFGGGLGAGTGEGEKKEPSEAEETTAETIFITTQERAVQVAGKKEVTASESEWASLYETVGQYGEQRPGYLATGAYERMSGAYQVLGPTHVESKYYKQVGYKKNVKSSAGRASRVAAWKKKHGEPTYSGTGHRVKASN